MVVFGRFVGEPSQAELEQFFYLDAADLEGIAERRGEHHRLGFALGGRTVWSLGVLMSDPLDVPWSVLEYLAAQLRISDSSVVKRYPERVATPNAHARRSAGSMATRTFRELRSRI